MTAGGSGAPIGCDPGPGVREPVVRVATQRPQVSITFDDLTRLNDRILRILDRFRMRATFFVTGEQARRHPTAVRAVVAHGHELANHSLAHEDLTAQPDSGYASLRAANRTIRRVSGFRPCQFRPPYLAYNERVTTAARSLSMTTVLATRGSDMYTDDSDAVVAHALDGVRPGDILLLHQVEHSVRALPRILTGLQTRGLRSVTALRLLRGAWVK
jgi:peptidoglycan/xylan/chitin deacetylase (PgdA/CDA1 family)